MKSIEASLAIFNWPSRSAESRVVVPALTASCVVDSAICVATNQPSGFATTPVLGWGEAHSVKPIAIPFTAEFRGFDQAMPVFALILAGSENSFGGVEKNSEKTAKIAMLCERSYNSYNYKAFMPWPCAQICGQFWWS
jgi:hypothetical protein